MNKFVHVLFAGLIIFGSFPIQSQSAEQKQEDCMICGHACCCPEMCAPKIKELKRKKAQSHCGSVAEKESAVKGCDQPVSICSLTSKDPVSVIFLQERLMQTKPVSWLVGVACPKSLGGKRLPRTNSILFVSPPIQEVLTPPPEAPAA